MIERLALGKPRLSAAAIHRRISAMAGAQAWPVPSYAAVHAITRTLDPALVTLAHEAPAAYRDRVELIHRHRAERPKAVWQADHTQLDILVLDAGGAPAPPWLTLVLDDHSRVIAGYCVFLGAPTDLAPGSRTKPLFLYAARTMTMSILAWAGVRWPMLECRRCRL